MPSKSSRERSIGYNAAPPTPERRNETCSIPIRKRNPRLIPPRHIIRCRQAPIVLIPAPVLLVSDGKVDHRTRKPKDKQCPPNHVRNHLRSSFCILQLPTLNEKREGKSRKKKPFCEMAEDRSKERKQFTDEKERKTGTFYRLGSS
jgi:hypothetical protein